MLTIAALIPDTALLVPGAAGRAVVLEDARAAAVAAVRRVIGTEPDRVVVVAPGPVDRVLDGPVRASLAAAGIAPGDLGWAVAEEGAAGPADVAADGPVTVAAASSVPVAGVGTSVVLLALGDGGWAGPVTVAEVSPTVPDQDGRAAALRHLGARLVAGPGRIALVLAGSLSARNGSSAPHPDDARAAPLDAAILADLALADAAARDRLGAIPQTLAVELAVTAWAPLQVLLGAAAAAESPIEARVRHADAPFGVTYPVVTWLASVSPADRTADRASGRAGGRTADRTGARSGAGEVAR